MANEDNEQQVAGGEAKSAKKGKMKLFLILIIAIVLMAGGAGGFWYLQHRTAQKVTARVATETKEKHESDDEAEVAEVVELLPFIVNLADQDEPKYLRMTISLGVGDGSEGKPDPVFTTKVRNAILAIVTTKTAEQILTVEGKTELRKEMLNAARSAVSKPDVRAIYITDFIVQM